MKSECACWKWFPLHFYIWAVDRTFMLPEIPSCPGRSFSSIHKTDMFRFLELFCFVCSLYKFRNGRVVLNCLGMYQHTPMHFKVYLQSAYFWFSFILSSNKNNMLIFDAKDYYEALDMVQKSQQLYTSDSILKEWLTEKATFLPKCRAQWFFSVLYTEVGSDNSLTSKTKFLPFPGLSALVCCLWWGILQSTGLVGKVGNNV